MRTISQAGGSIEKAGPQTQNPNRASKIGHEKVGGKGSRLKKHLSLSRENDNSNERGIGRPANKNKIMGQQKPGRNAYKGA